MIKNKILSLSFLVVVLILGSGSFTTVSSNVSNDYENLSIREPGGYYVNSLPEILVLHADSVSSLDFAMTGLSGYSPVYLDASVSTPAITDINSYPLLVLMNNWNYMDPTSLGDVLADYLDGGGRILQLAHSFSSGVGVLGRFNSSGYSPVWGSVTNVNRTYDGLSVHSIMTGVTSFNPQYAQTVTLTPGAELLASYNDGQPMLALKGSVVALNAYVGFNVVGDLGTIITNAVNYLLKESVLLLYADGLTSADLVASAITKYTVDKFNVGVANATLSQLIQYPVVIVFNNNNYFNSTETGNILGDYLDAGGKVIQMAHTFSFGWHVAGRFYDSNYTVFRGTNTNIARVYDLASSHPILNGVTSFSAGNSMDVTLTPGSDLIASFTDGHPMMGIKNNVVALNVYPGLGVSGDLGVILDNSIEFLQFPPPLDEKAPEITGFVEAAFEYGDPSALISWEITDESYGQYDVYLDGILESSGNWEDFVIAVGFGLSDYSIGTYVFQITATDIHGNQATHSTIVYIWDTTAPSVESMDRLSYIQGSTNNFLSWYVSDLDPGLFEIYSSNLSGDELPILSGEWVNGETIEVNIDGLDPGEYVYTAEFTDGSGNIVVVETLVTVESRSLTSAPPPTTTIKPTTTEDDTPTSEDDTKNPNLPLPFANIYLITFSILGIVLISRKKTN